MRTLPDFTPRQLGILFLGFVGLALFLYASSFRGHWVGDDWIYVTHNVAVHEFDVAAILDPGGRPAAETANYAPLHLLLHSAQWQVFGDDPWAFRVTNAIAHAGVCVLLALLFTRMGIGRPGAAFGALLFLVHPGNAEAVAWIFQLKTMVSLAAVLGALLLRERHPAWALVLFAAALLTKITAAVGLPLAIVHEMLRPPGAPDRRRRVAMLAAWAAVLAGVMIPEFVAFGSAGSFSAPFPAELGDRVRFSFALVARYLWMSATGAGLSASHEPELTVAPSDPGWLFGLAFVAFAAWRSLAALRDRRAEAFFWAFAAAGFLPVSQLLAFRFPLADRYLYTILPGVIGLLLCAARPALDRVEAAWAERPKMDLHAVGIGVAAVVVTVAFAARTLERAPVYRLNTTLVEDAARNYPEGSSAALLAIPEAAARGDAAEVSRLLRRAFEKGFTLFQVVAVDPTVMSFAQDERVRSVLVDMARFQIDRFETAAHPPQSFALAAARAYVWLGDLDGAEGVLTSALAAGGPFDGDLERELAGVRALRPAKGP